MQALLAILADGRFHSGELLGSALGLSRSAVWKRLQALQAETGLVVDKVRGKGYRLQRPLSLLDEELITAALPELDVCVHQTVTSTNSLAQEYAAANTARKPVLVLAEKQTRGRGRRGRSWVSPYAGNIYASLVYPLASGLQQAKGVSLVMALAVLRTLQSRGLTALSLKWPNDVLCGNKKISGILLELLGDPSDACQLIIGLGINVNMREEQQAIEQPWTSLAAELGVMLDRSALVVDLAKHLIAHLKRLEGEGFSQLRDEWMGFSAWQGQDVQLSSGDTVIAGRLSGVDEDGSLLLEIDGHQQRFSGGELSLRLAHDS